MGEETLRKKFLFQFLFPIYLQPKGGTSLLESEILGSPFTQLSLL